MRFNSHSALKVVKAISPARWRDRAPFLAMGSLYLYLGFHALSGSQGLVKWMDAEDRADRLEVKFLAVQTYKTSLQGEVDRLAAKSLDLDTLDIESRRTLFVSSPQELTIWLDPATP